jgi:hypothetical protein
MSGYCLRARALLFRFLRFSELSVPVASDDHLTESSEASLAAASSTKSITCFHVPAVILDAQVMITGSVRFHICRVFLLMTR